MSTQPTEDPTETVSRAKLLDLSLTQLLGGSMAAATAAALGSRLGVMGTIVGAAVGSVVTAVAASLYTGSMTRAREAVVAARSHSRGLTETPRPHWWRRPDRTSARRLLATTGALFAIAAAFLTGLQLATGAPVTGTNLGTRSAVAGTVDESSGNGDAGRLAVTRAPSDTATPTSPPTAPSANTPGAFTETPTDTTQPVSPTTPSDPSAPAPTPTSTASAASEATSPLPATP